MTRDKMIYKYKHLTEEDIKILTQFLKPDKLIKFDIILDAVCTGESKILENLETEFGIYFNENGEKLLENILKRHGYRTRKVTLTHIEKE